MNQSTVKLFFSVLVIGLINSNCQKSDTQKWDQTKTYTYSVNDGTGSYGEDSTTVHDIKLVVGPNTVSEGGVIFYDLVNQNKTFEKYDLEVGSLIPDYEVVSDFMLLSGNTDAFLAPNTITIEYTQYQEYQYPWNDYQYYYHSDLQLYKINHYNNVDDEMIKMSNWTQIPCVFSDTVATGRGKITAEITEINALYVVARKYN